MIPLADPAGKGPIPALVLGGGVTALAVIRELGRARIPIWHVAPEGDLSTCSRWSRLLPGCADAESDGLPRILEWSGLADAVLFPCNDPWAMAVASLAEDRGGRFRRTGPPRRVLELLVDKAAFARLLFELDLPHPRTEVLSSPDDLARLPDELLRGAFLKPIDSHAFGKAFGRKALWLEDRYQARRALEQAHARGLRFLLQEYVPSRPADRVHLDGFVDRLGRMRSCYGRRRLRMYPADFGNSTLSRVVSLDEVREPYTDLRRLLETIGFRGIFDAEFVYDRRRQEHQLVEVNARPFWQVALGATCGAPLCTMAWRDALGEEVETIERCAVGARWSHEAFDLRAWLAGMRGGKRLAGGPPPLAWRGARALFAVDDPRPALTQLARYLRRSLGRLPDAWHALPSVRETTRVASRW